MIPSDKNRLKTRLVRVLEKAWTARMLSPGEKIHLADELTDRLCEGPGWMVREILAKKADLPLSDAEADLGDQIRKQEIEERLRLLS